MKPCCVDTANSIMEHTRGEKWRKHKKKMIKQFGKVLNLTEMKDLAEKDGVTLYDKMKELGAI